MRRALVLFSILFCSLFIPASDAQKTYDDLVAKAKAGDTSVDFKQMRIAYLDTKQYQSFDYREAMKPMFQAFNQKKFAEALKVANSVIEQKFATLDAQFVAYVCNKELGNEEKAQFHRGIVKALMYSITGGKDGRSLANAWTITEVSEEYSMLRLLGYMPKQQALKQDGGHSYDVMKVTDGPDGTEMELFFNVDISWGQMEKALK